MQNAVNNSKGLVPTLKALFNVFMGDAPVWYKQFILCCLVLNPILFAVSPFLAGWCLVGEFIFTLAMALKCYPLIPGGILAIEAIFTGMTDTTTIYHEIEANLEVILLLMFMVAGIHFVKKLLLLVFTQLLVKVRSKVMLSLIFCFMAAFLSAFLDALTVLAVIITVCSGFYAVYHEVIAGAGTKLNDNEKFTGLDREDLDNFRTFLRSLLMHAGVGTALGGICTIVGEPQNLIIGHIAGWHFSEFALRVMPVSAPVFVLGLITCWAVETFKIFDFGVKIPEKVFNILKESSEKQTKAFSKEDRVSIIMQAITCCWLIIGLAYHLAVPGLIGLSVIVLATVFTGVNKEHEIGQAFTENMPFTTLLCVFFAVVAVINSLGLFDPIIHAVLSVSPENQLPLFYIANGILSMVSDNVFVATVYINQVAQALACGKIDAEQFNHLAIAINAGTNLPSVATPNGQAAFLFLLTSALAPLIRLSYVRMMWMALPYTIVMGVAGFLCTWLVLPEVTDWFISMGWVTHTVPEGLAQCLAPVPVP